MSCQILLSGLHYLFTRSKNHFSKVYLMSMPVRRPNTTSPYAAFVALSSVTRTSWQLDFDKAACYQPKAIKSIKSTSFMVTPIQQHCPEEVSLA
jgi:hypothetical protein